MKNILPVCLFYCVRQLGCHGQVPRFEVGAGGFFVIGGHEIAVYHKFFAVVLPQKAECYNIFANLFKPQLL